MKKEVAMTSFRKHLLTAGLLASIGFAAVAQGTAGSAPPAAPADATHAHARMGPHDPAKMQQYRAEHMAKRQAALKEKLQITPAQEAAWSTFTAALTPPAMGQRPDRAEFEKLTTPQRIDKMREMRTQHMAAMDQRADATKAFYAQLTPDQQKVFDAQTLRRGHGMRGGMHGGMGMHEGMGGHGHGPRS